MWSRNSFVNVSFSLYEEIKKEAQKKETIQNIKDVSAVVGGQLRLQAIDVIS